MEFRPCTYGRVRQRVAPCPSEIVVFGGLATTVQCLVRIVVGNSKSMEDKHNANQRLPGCTLPFLSYMVRAFSFASRLGLPLGFSRLIAWASIYPQLVASCCCSNKQQAKVQNMHLTVVSRYTRAPCRHIYLLVPAPKGTA